MYRVKIVADSVTTCPITLKSVRLTSMECTFPRYILAEANTHRTFSRNSASSRAIPVHVRADQVERAPFIPPFTKNQAGMTAKENVSPALAVLAEAIWTTAAEVAAASARALDALKVHKQQANRLLEPFVWHTMLITSTEWENFFALRAHNDAAPEMQEIAQMMLAAYTASHPRVLFEGERHLPYITEDELDLLRTDAASAEVLVAASVARCAAISFERQDVRKSYEESVKREREFIANGHWSPLEHQARVATMEEIAKYATFRIVAAEDTISRNGNGSLDAKHAMLVPDSIGNFAVPWLQYRKTHLGEDVFSPKKP